MKFGQVQQLPCLTSELAGRIKDRLKKALDRHKCIARTGLCWSWAMSRT